MRAPSDLSECGVQVTYSPADHFGSNQTQPITFYFSKPVERLAGLASGFGTEDCNLRQWEAMTWIAYSPQGIEIARGGFSQTNTQACTTAHPYTEPEVTFDMNDPGPISKLTITPPVPMPADGGVVGYAVNFWLYYDVACPTTGDSLLDSRAVREGMLDEMSASRPDINSPERAERRFGIYRRTDGTFFIQHVFDPTATQCGFNFGTDLPPIIQIEGTEYMGDGHTHPNKDGEVVTDCGTLPSGQQREADRDEKSSGGGSKGDWDFATRRKKPMYVINLEREVYRLDPSVPVDDRPSNQNKWRLNKTTACLERMQ